MQYLYAVVVAQSKGIAAYHIFVIVLLYIHKICSLAIGTVGELNADLNVYPFVSANRNEVYLLGTVLADIDLIAAAFHFEVHDILEHRRKHFCVEAYLTVLDGNIGEIILLLSFEYRLALQVIP